MKLPVAPWKDWEEWELVYQGLFDDNSQSVGQLNAISRIRAWTCRSGNLPAAVIASMAFVDLLNRLPLTPNDMEYSLRLAFSTSIVRFVNAMVDPLQKSRSSLPMNVLAEQLQLPGMLVEIRHNATHGSLPSLALLEHAAHLSLHWLRAHYWEPQRCQLLAVREPVVQALARLHEACTQVTACAAAAALGGPPPPTLSALAENELRQQCRQLADQLLDAAGTVDQFVGLVVERLFSPTVLFAHQLVLERQFVHQHKVRRLSGWALALTQCLKRWPDEPALPLALLRATLVYARSGPVDENNELLVADLCYWAQFFGQKLELRERRPVTALVQSFVRAAAEPGPGKNEPVVARVVDQVAQLLPAPSSADHAVPLPPLGVLPGLWDKPADLKLAADLDDGFVYQTAPDWRSTEMNPATTTTLGAESVSPSTASVIFATDNNEDDDDGDDDELSGDNERNDENEEICEAKKKIKIKLY